MDAPFGGKWRAGEDWVQSEHRPRWLARPTSPRRVLRGAVAPRWPRVEGSWAAISPQPREGSRVLFILPKTSLECLLGNKGSWGAGPGSPPEGLPEGRGQHRTMLGVPGASFPRPTGRSSLRGAGGETWDAGPPPGSGARPSQRETAGWGWVKGCPPFKRGSCLAAEASVASL